MNSHFAAPYAVADDQPLILTNDVSDIMDFADLDALDLDFFVKSEDEALDHILNDISETAGVSEAVAFSSSSQEQLKESSFTHTDIDAPIVYLDSSESGIQKSSLIDWLVLEKKAAQRRFPGHPPTAPLSDSLEDGTNQKALSPICALLRKTPRPVSPSTPTFIKSRVTLAFPPTTPCQASRSSSSQSSAASECSAMSSMFLSFASKPMISRVACTTAS
jgi:hypothetical protein